MARPSAPPSGRRSQSSRVAVGWVGPAAQHLNADDPRVKAWELRFGHGTGLWGAGELVPTALLEGILLFRRCSARRPRRWHNGTTRLQGRRRRKAAAPAPEISSRHLAALGPLVDVFHLDAQRLLATGLGGLHTSGRDRGAYGLVA